MPVYTETQVREAIESARTALRAADITVPEWESWADDWLSGENRSGAALFAIGACGKLMSDLTFWTGAWPLAPEWRRAALIAEAADAANLAFIWFSQQRAAAELLAAPILRGRS